MSLNIDLILGKVPFFTYMRKVTSFTYYGTTHLIRLTKSNDPVYTMFGATMVLGHLC